MNQQSTAEPAVLGARPMPIPIDEPNAPNGTVTVTLDLEKLFKASRDQTVAQVLDDLLVTAIEGGSPYWCGAVHMADPIDMATPARTWYASAFENRLTMRVREDDTEDGDGIWHEGIDYQKGVEGLIALALTHPRHFFAIAESADDAESADAWFQMTVLGEVRYG